ncbi:hypothetical protein AVEN_57638-1 [Araneus ventricosus]|uniref:Uncharacterized protein n=1 Tax=Araneus ventricosus TaxID=182803 RepID=A0A4Y2QPI8_ARAVE|nr:hypothetical protein AVEN_57638-1 [Araneus ventricosus]
MSLYRLADKCPCTVHSGDVDVPVPSTAVIDVPVPSTAVMNILAVPIEEEYIPAASMNDELRSSEDSEKEENSHEIRLYSKCIPGPAIMLK